MELEKKQLEQQQAQWEAEMQLKKEQLAEEKRQFDKQYEQKQASYNSGSSGSGAAGKTVETNTGSSGSWRREERGIASNMASLQALGLGNVTASDLARLLDQGIITRTLKNGVYYYSRGNNNQLKNMGLSIE